MYLNSISKDASSFTILDEFKKTKNDILVATGMRKEEKITPVVPDKDTENEEEINENVLTIPEGTDANTLGSILLEKGLIADVNAYNALVDDMQIRDKIVPGSYEIPEDAKVKEILAMISNTELKEFTFTIAEGSTIADNANMLKEIGLIKSPIDFINACNNLGVSAFKPGEHKIVMPMKVNSIINELKMDIWF